MTGQRLSFDPEFNLRWFDVPGFDDLYSTWSEIFATDDNGRYSCKASKALEMLGDVHAVVQKEHGLTNSQISRMSGIARRYAGEMPTELEIEISFVDERNFDA